MLKLPSVKPPHALSCSSLTPDLLPTTNFSTTPGSTTLTPGHTLNFMLPLTPGWAVNSTPFHQLKSYTSSLAVNLPTFPNYKPLSRFGTTTCSASPPTGSPPLLLHLTLSPPQITYPRKLRSLTTKPWHTPHHKHPKPLLLPLIIHAHTQPSSVQASRSTQMAA